MNRIISIFYKRLFYILLFFVAILTKAQSKPGNTSLTVELWLKADQLNLTNGSEVNTWSDLSENSLNFSKYTANSSPGPLFITNEMNYNPALDFSNVSSGYKRKLVGPDNILSSTKEYYVFYVSKASTDNSGYSTVFQFNTSNYNPAVGWYNYDRLWYTNRENNTFNTDKIFSINSLYLPNSNESSTSAVKTIFYSNNFAVHDSRAQILNYSLYPMTIGTGNLTTGNPFYGTISEIIVLSKPKASGLPEMIEINKINSYLSLKYGINLNNNFNYYDSDYNIIWNKDLNVTYNNYIFGIGRDNKTALYQKQSTNYDNNDIEIFLGNLATTNKLNTNTINSDNSFLLLGSNGLHSTKFYKYNLGTTFNNSETLQKPIYKRFNRVYKASNTNFTNKINIKLNNNLANATHLLISDDELFAPSNTNIYPISNGVIENINIPDGKYISFVSPEKAPGGTDLTIEFWLNSNNLNLPENSNITAWADESYFQRNFIQNGTNPVPTMNYNGMNFNPALKFGTATNTKLVGPVNIIDPNKEYYIFYVSKTDRTGTSGDQTVLAFNQDYHNSYGWQGSKPWFYTNTANTTSTYNVGIQYSINAAFLPNQGVNTLKNNLYVNGFLANQSNGYLLLTSTSNLMTIGTYNTGTGNNFTGDINEIIVLSKTKNTGLPNTSEIQKINSYLAIKYGITLDTSEQPDYFDSEGTVIWDGSENSGYQNSIFGIGRDDLSGLYQKQATNIDTKTFTISLGRLQETNKSNTNTIDNNNSYLILGANNREDVIGYNYHNNGLNFYQRFAKTLKVSNTTNGNPITENSSIGIKTVDFKLDNELIKSTYIIVSSDVNFSSNTTRVYPVENGIAKDVTLYHNDYVSFIPKEYTPGGISGFKREYWLVADDINGLEDGNDVRNWTNRADIYNNFVNVNSTSLVPVYTRKSMNFHSAIDFAHIDRDDGGPNTASDNEDRKLISEKDFSASTSKSYYVVTISNVFNDDITGYNTLLSLNTNNTYGWFKDDGVTRPWYQTNDTNYTNIIPNEDRTYGITITMIPNTTPQYLSLNGAKSTNEAIRAMRPNASKSILGSESLTATGNTNFFRGEVMEVMVLSKDTPGVQLTTDEINKINTYYAIKYGVSLNNLQTQYKLSNGQVIYDVSNSSYSEYNKDIFGIARDDQSSLNQKQSISTDFNAMAIYLGNLEEHNNENTSDYLNNYETLMLGAKGDALISTEYLAIPGTAFSNYTLIETRDPNTDEVYKEQLNKLYSYIYKARVTKEGALTGASITVNLAPNLGQWLLISKNPNFPPAETFIKRIKGGKVEGVVIEDGDYIGFAYYMQSPGGVSNALRMWLNASEAETIEVDPSNNEILSWTDYAGLGTTYKKRARNNASAQYLKADERTNYHPTALFRKWQDYLITDKSPMQNAAPQYSTLFNVVNHNFATDRSYFIGFGAQAVATNARRPAFGVYRASNGGRGRIGSTGLTYSSANLFNPGATTIAGFTWHRGSTITFDFDSNIQTVPHTYNSAVMNGPGMLGLASSSTSYYLQGTMPEVIAYERDLDQNERNKINSYLGTKYAITLRSNTYNNDGTVNTTSNFNYVFSNGNSFWNGNDPLFSPYHNHVASIIKDEQSNLYNKQAKSTDVGGYVHIGVPKSLDPNNKLGVDADLGIIRENLSALTWGNNTEPDNKILQFGSDPNICGKMDSRLDGKIWKAKPTNFDQNVIVRASELHGFYYGSGYQVYLLLADSPEKLTANNWDQIVPMYYVDNGHQVNYKFDPNKPTYFTFGGKLTASCEYCNFEGERTLEFTRATWPTSGARSNYINNLDDNFKIQINVEESTSGLLRNRYPRYSSRKSLRERRRGNGTVTTRLKFTDREGNPNATIATFDLLDIDRAGYTLDDVQVIGKCGGSNIYPKLYYSYNRPERSRYTIDNFTGKATAKAPGVRYSGSSGYTNARGIAIVEFENPVDEIEIIYKTPSARGTFSTQEIGIGKINFYCITPPPPPNEDGLVFTKQATSKALLCEIVDYNFRIINTNCNEKEITLVDKLPKGMKWDLNSITVLDPNYVPDPNNPEQELYTEAIETTDAEGRNTLKITGLKAPGAGVTYTVRASAIFEDDAVAGIYKNQATINYKRISNGNEYDATLTSTDRLTGEAESETEALYSERPKRLETEFSLEDTTCFSLNKTIKASLAIENKNNFPMSNLSLNLGFTPEGIRYIANSLIASGITLNTTNADGENYLNLEDVLDGNINLENFTIPANYRTVITLEFRTSADLIDYTYPVSDPNDIPNPIPIDYMDPAPINFSYDLYSESDEECMDTTTIFTFGDVDLEFCQYCTQPPVGGATIGTKVGISTFKDKFTNWPDSVPNGFLVLESGRKGMVITRTTPSKIENPVPGMIIYNTDSKCLSIFVSGPNEWKCIERACNE